AGLQARRKTRRVEAPRAGWIGWAIAAAAAVILAAGLYASLSPSSEPGDQRSAKKTPTPKIEPERPRTPEPVPPKSVAPPTPAPEEKLRQDREKIERDLLDARTKAENLPVPPKPEAPPPAPPAPPAPDSPRPAPRPEPPAPTPVAPTEAAIARIDALSGAARLLSKGASVPAAAKADLRPGQ